MSPDPADRVAAIVAAAEQAANDLLARTEEQVRARIAEATRAADERVRAAETEVGELLEAARAEADAARAEAEAARGEAETVRREAESLRLEAFADAERLREEAEQRALLLRDSAREEAREIVADANDAARDVLREGTVLSGHLRQLSDSLRANAELLLRDVRGAHGELVARLPEDSRPAAGDADPDGYEPDVPEFIPGRPR